jgi:hypothetical protein
MKRYLLSVMQPQGGLPPREFLEKVVRDLDAVNREMKAAGAWVFAGGLQPLSVAKVARLKDAQVLISDGPFAETKEFLGGISIIAAPSLEAAPKGRNETSVWWRRHDEYEPLSQDAGSCCHGATAPP